MNDELTFLRAEVERLRVYEDRWNYIELYAQYYGPHSNGVAANFIFPADDNEDVAEAVDTALSEERQYAAG